MPKSEKKISICFIVLAAVVILNMCTTFQREEEIVNSINIIQKVLKHYRRYIPDCMASRQASVIKSEIFHGYVKEKLDRLRLNLDKTSNEVLDYVEKAITYDEVRRVSNFENLAFQFPLYHQQHRKIWKEKEQSEVNKKYNLLGCLLSPEVFYFHHGLRFANQKIKNYIKNKDILDCGAFVGDSVLILKDYTDKNIFCYEFYKPCLEKFHKIMKLNNVTSGYKLIPLALGENIKNAKANSESIVACPFEDSHKQPTDEVVSITTIDEEVKKHNFKVGFIKVDVEGHGFKLIKGAINTIKNQRPVLSIGVYHSKSELFEIKPFLEKSLDNYIFEFQLQSFKEGDLNELTLFCYPKELS